MNRKLLIFIFTLFLLPISITVVGQNTISGIVIDKKTGETLPGVIITVKGQTVGTTSDYDGEFSLSVNAAAKTLVFSYLGYERQEIGLDKIKDPKSVTVLMAEKATSLD